MSSISACIPYYNNKNTIQKVVESILAQEVSVQEIIIYNDGSTEKPDRYINSKLVRVINNTKNNGRGYVRHTLCNEAKAEFILFCDATNTLPNNFISNALLHFKEPSCVAVSGLIKNDKSLQSTAIRWRARHLFKEKHDFGQKPKVVECLTTYGTLMRRSQVIEIGNFNKNLKHSEDKELGNRIIMAGLIIIGDPKIFVRSIKKDTWSSVLERYWRWYGGINYSFTFNDYCHSIKASVNPLLVNDLRDKDFRAAIISLISPHYGYAKALFNKLALKNN